MIVCGQELILRKWGNNGSEKDANAVRPGLCRRHRPLVARDGYLRLTKSLMARSSSSLMHTAPHESVASSVMRFTNSELNFIQIPLAFKICLWYLTQPVPHQGFSLVWQTVYRFLAPRLGKYVNTLAIVSLSGSVIASMPKSSNAFA